jgi:hypothetical protein
MTSTIKVTAGPYDTVTVTRRHKSTVFGPANVTDTVTTTKRVVRHGDVLEDTIWQGVTFEIEEH